MFKSTLGATVAFALLSVTQANAQPRPQVPPRAELQQVLRVGGNRPRPAPHAVPEMSKLDLRKGTGSGVVMKGDPPGTSPLFRFVVGAPTMVAPDTNAIFNAEGLLTLSNSRALLDVTRSVRLGFSPPNDTSSYEIRCAVRDGLYRVAVDAYADPDHIVLLNDSTLRASGGEIAFTIEPIAPRPIIYTILLLKEGGFETAGCSGFRR